MFKISPPFSGGGGVIKNYNVRNLWPALYILSGPSHHITKNSISDASMLDVLRDGDESTCISSNDLDLHSFTSNSQTVIRVLSDVSTTDYISGTAVFGSAVDCCKNQVFFSQGSPAPLKQSCNTMVEAECNEDDQQLRTRCRYTMHCDATQLLCEIYIISTASMQHFSLCELYL